MKVLGVDGCKYGWCVSVHMDNLVSLELYGHIEEIIKAHPGFKIMFIDIPIGLSGGGMIRTLDQQLRNQLKPHKHTSVFNAPCREALQAANYVDASFINQQVEGKGISQQTYNISTKILEVDEFLKNNLAMTSKIFESHPEFCFKQLNNGEALKTSKKTMEGRNERLSVLQIHFPRVSSLLESQLQQTKRKDVAADDFVDALCLGVCAKQAAIQGIQFLQSPDNSLDALHIPMAIAYANFS